MPENITFGQQKKDESTNNDLQNTIQNTKD